MDRLECKRVLSELENIRAELDVLDSELQDWFSYDGNGITDSYEALDVIEEIVRGELNAI